MTRPLPRLTALNRFYWTSGADGVLRFLRCTPCGHWIHPPQPLCPVCLSEDIAPQPVAGTGTIYSVTVNYQVWKPDLPVPYVIARVAIDGADGVMLTTNIIGSEPDDVRIDDRVEVVFEEQDGIWFPLFRKTEKAMA